jgi:hypothetical protein
MDAEGNIYEIPDEQKDDPVTKEDVARLDGFLRGRAEADRIRHEKFEEKKGKLVWDSQRQGTYRKNQTIGGMSVEQTSE